MKKIVFLCLGSQFSPYMYYKDNYMIRAAVEAEHQVLVVTTNKMYIDGVEREVPEGKDDSFGYTIIRKKNKNLGIRVLTEKIRYTSGLDEIICSFSPDLIFFNCPQIYNVNDLKTLKKRMPNVKVIWDFSTWYGNSGKNALSLNVLHKGIYRKWLKQNQKYVNKIYYTADDPHTFIREVYGLDESKMELHDLPGEVIEFEEKRDYRKRIEKELNLSAKDILFIHTGKMNKSKKTIELIRAFSNCDDLRFKLIIVGSLDEEIRNETMKLINLDKRIFYLGFKKGEELIRILRGCDIYVQPGSTSQTLNDAVCCGCAIAYKTRNYDNKLIGDCGWRFEQENDIESFFVNVSNIQKLEILIKQYGTKMIDVARERLDYQKLYKRMWEE